MRNTLATQQWRAGRIRPRDRRRLGRPAAGRGRAFLRLAFVKVILVFGILLLRMGAPGASAAEPTLTVSAAASLADPMREIKALYLKKHPEVRVALNLGGSGVLQVQIEQGAPVDIFAPAGWKQMEALVARGLVDSAEVRFLAANRLVLVVPSTESERGSRIHSLADLLRSDVRSVAIGSEKTVPAGMYAAQTLRKMDLLERLRAKLVPGEDVRQVVQYVATGAAQAGFAYRTDVTPGSGVRIALEIPDETHEPILYAIAPLARGEWIARAREFVAVALGPDGQAIFRSYGFLPSPEPRRTSAQQEEPSQGRTGSRP